VIDSYQTYVNGTPAAPDSNTRIDAELVMDILKTLISIETSLGANFMGQFGSLAARLNAFLPGSGGLPGLVTFTNATSVAIPGTTHNVGQAAFLWQLYNSNIPAQAIDPGSVTVQVDPTTYDLFLTFASPTSGYIALGATAPLFLTSFSNTDTVSVLGSTHQLGTADLLFKVYDNGSPRRTAMEPGSLTVDPDTYDVVMRFGAPLSGILVLSAGSPAYATTFTGVSTVTIPGSTHRLGTQAILFQLYDAADPRAALAPAGVTVNPNTYDVVFTFATATSGRIVLGAASTTSGREFDIRDSGVVNLSAVRLHSEVGNAYIQTGTGQHIYFQDKNGISRLAMDLQNTRLGIGTSTPTHQLELTVDDAVKPGGGSWLAPSDERQKEGVRPFTDGLDVLLQLDPIRFRYNGLGGTVRSPDEQIGFVAQAVQAVAPYMVRARRGWLTPGEPETTLLALDTSALPYILVNALKTLHAWLHTVMQASAQMRDELATLQARLARLEEAQP